jgi:hypothetical protein
MRMFDPRRQFVSAQRRSGNRVRLLFSIGVLFVLTVGGCRSAEKTSSGTTDNEVILYLRGAERQAESPTQEQEILKALEDLRTLPPEQLRARRYADYAALPGQWTLAQLLQKYFVPVPPRTIDEEALYRDAQAASARATIEEHIRAIREQRQVTKAR